MLKQLILYFNLFSLSLITIFLSDGIEIESNLPKELVKDSTYIVDVVITKGSLFGFAKYQQNFPEGFDAKPVETSEASFTFADGKMKFIWMALPETDEVKITYALTAYDDAAEESIVEGKFSYIHDNQRKSYDIPNRTIRVISEEPKEEKVPALAEASRVIKPLGDNRYEIMVNIQKQGVYGFAKLEELLPEGAEAEVVENKKAVFSQVDERAKFVWMSIPEDESLQVTYTVKADEDIMDRLQSMEGSLAFLDDSQTKTVAVQAGAPLMSEESESTPEPEEAVQEVAEIPVQEPEVDVSTPEEPIAETPTPTEKKEEKAQAIAEQTPEVKKTPQPPAPKKQPATRIPEPEGDLVYRVQIIAGHKMVDASYIRKTYKFQEDYITDNHEGWIKYLTSNSFSVYKQARDKRESLIASRHNFPGPFVTAYNAGERITVQEALMITNQQWFK